MFEHFILMASSYKRGTRIALHFAFDEGIDENKIETPIRAIYDSIGEAAKFSTHYVCTDDASWDSVVAYDPFFSDAYLLESLEEFIYIMKQDMDITGLDIAKYILSKRPCTHLELEKLTYLCYADYLCKYDEPMCRDKVFAFRYGPVLETVYDEYFGRKDTLSFEDEKIAKSRLLIDGASERVKSIDETLKKYESASVSELIDITHCKNGPWSMKDATRFYQIIDDALILDRHHFEDEYYFKHFIRQ